VVDTIRHDVELGEQNAEVPLRVLDLDVAPGDLIHADHHGAWRFAWSMLMQYRMQSIR
jgi:regulator of RNase E activity RraA